MTATVITVTAVSYHFLSTHSVRAPGQANHREYLIEFCSYVSCVLAEEAERLHKLSEVPGLTTGGTRI